jgi:hypothetical protein
MYPTGSKDIAVNHENNDEVNGMLAQQFHNLGFQISQDLGNSWTIRANNADLWFILTCVQM